MKRKEVAKFFCGFEAFHTAFHAYLWFSSTTFAAFGILVSPTVNILGVLVSGSITLLLGFYAWGVMKSRMQAQPAPSVSLD